MHITTQNPIFTVIDDFLPPDEFALMLEYMHRTDYARNPRWIKPWDLADEMPWASGETVHTRGKPLHPQDPRKAYPTGMAIDRLLERIRATDFYRDVVPDTYVTARNYLHGPGAGLDWHDDGGRFAGAYTFYAHPHWHASWGGELLIIEDAIGRDPLPDKTHLQGGLLKTIKGSWNVLTKEDLSAMLMERATSTAFVFAKPNRLVFLTRYVWHKVNPVRPSAPFPRTAVAGFFLTDEDETPFWR
jgi:Rps23 Pro-64 3,4-dihydroxylase Tpa1-like proline 4-hydroxylase